MAIKIHTLKRGEFPPPAALTVTRTPSGKWEISGSEDIGGAALFMNTPGLTDREAAVSYASKWGEDRGVTDLYILGDPAA